ncbi:MAG: hypothetical protein A2148_05505 [Chloroflexi bacterium RBG_16_68_14]|nr:MAG: hypothetical protein A2148_05505 [Chloroflexi bacterium RBG_16_68_14]
MPTSPPPRSTPRSPTSTSAASTSRPTPAPNRRNILRRAFSNRPGQVGAVLALLATAVLVAACGGDGSSEQPPLSSPALTTEPTAAPSTGSDEPPQRDLADLARRFRGLTDPPRQIQLPPPALGDIQQFDLLVLPSGPEELPERRTVSATLRAVSEHAYFFFEEGADVDDGQVDAAVRVLEETVWPRVTGAFGPPPIPGVDGDPRIVLLHADLGSAVAGYVSDEDAYPREVVSHSNQREMIYLNLTQYPLGSPGYTQLLAHEFQHVIHRGLDADEETWVGEGLSEVAAALVGDGTTFSNAFLEQPDTQLNAWTELQSSAAHYGASSLFFAYLLEQTEGGVRQLAAEPANGVDGVRAFLRATGSARTFDQLVADWAVANFLDEPEGPYGYRGREVSGPTTTGIEGPGPGEGEAGQFGADYLEVRAGEFADTPTFVFRGETQVPVLAAQETAAGSFWWSNRGDNIDATLTRELDLTGVQQATLTFRTWFDIERWYDYGYVAASRDGGRTWTALSGSQTTTEDPLGVGYGPGYTGRSGGGEAPQWVEERIDLSAYAGARILLRFEYLTDDSTSESGWAIEDIAVLEFDFFDDAEADIGGWRREGFRRVDDLLPQRFQLRLITLGPAPEVEVIALDNRNEAQVALPGLGAEYQTAVIVILGATEGTTEPARYRYEVTE